MVDHSHKWHIEENNKNSTPLRMIAEKLKSLNHDMGSLREDVQKIYNGPHHEELKTIRTIKNNNIGFTKDMTRKFGLKETFERYLRESYKTQEDLDGWIKRFIQKTDQDLIRHNAVIKSLGERVTCLAHTISTNQSDRTPITHPASDNANFVKQECVMKLEPSHDIPFTKVETFAEKVKRRIMEDNENREKFLRWLESEPVNTPLVNDIRKTLDYNRRLQELVSNKTKIEELSMVKLNARCSAVLQNELPPKEKDPGHFILPLIVGNTSVSNALADLGASSVMPFSMSKRLGLGNPKLINMMIEMADISMQSPKDIVKNVLVKIHNLIFLVDFVILDIIEDDKVPIILGRPMLATAHAKIDVFGK
ncbi:DOF zinc finger protein DOF5.7-like protein, partial [Tanacetum coccineum]